ncbi:MAG: hypothetical protein GY773_23145, partial [Actinomycetia bacterium]|nr:hypothetical protein [Actinomycetes bacterium]
MNVKSKQIDQFCVFTTDRVLTGQDGARFSSLEEAKTATGFPALLAANLFEGDDATDTVFVAGNDVIVGRTDRWSAADIETARSTIGSL